MLGKILAVLINISKQDKMELWRKKPKTQQLFADEVFQN